MCDLCVQRNNARPGDPCETCGSKDALLVRADVIRAACVECWQSWRVDYNQRRQHDGPLVELLRRVDVSAYPVILRLGVRTWQINEPHVFSQMLVPDRFNNDIHISVSNDMWNVTEGLNEEDFFIGVRKGLRDTVLHELDEHLRIDGRLSFDPHDFQTYHRAVHGLDSRNTPVVAPDDPRVPGFPTFKVPEAPYSFEAGKIIKVFTNGTQVKFGPEERGGKAVDH
jgi:hypothetical protein